MISRDSLALFVPLCFITIGMGCAEPNPFAPAQVRDLGCCTDCIPYDPNGSLAHTPEDYSLIWVSQFDPSEGDTTPLFHTRLEQERYVNECFESDTCQYLDTRVVELEVVGQEGLIVDRVSMEFPEVYDLITAGESCLLHDPTAMGEDAMVSWHFSFLREGIPLQFWCAMVEVNTCEADFDRLNVDIPPQNW